jgi:RNA polymerase sigma-70 factor (ECF subfamily)
MSDEAVNTVQLNAWVDRMRGGDLTARDEPLRSAGNRLERLARKMLHRFPSVQRWAETGDVLQNALLRLLRALQQVRPGSVPDFFGLAAEQMRRQLLDLVRHFHGPEGLAAHHASGVFDQGAGARAPEPQAPAEKPDGPGKWAAFHEGVGALPAEEREFVGLVSYHGWTQRAVAELFQVSVCSVQRRWESALRRLHDVVKGQPE